MIVKSPKFLSFIGFGGVRAVFEPGVPLKIKGLTSKDIERLKAKGCEVIDDSLPAPKPASAPAPASAPVPKPAPGPALVHTHLGAAKIDSPKYVETDLKDKAKKDLVAIAGGKGLSVDGTKDDLIQRILESQK